MSSNIRLRKVCQHCHYTFIAKTTVTKLCSDNCAKRNYKKRLKEKKITEAILDANCKLSNDSGEQNTVVPGSSSAIDRFKRDWLNLQDLSLILGITERTLFRAMKREGFPKVKIGRRVLFNKQQVEYYLISKSEGI